MTALPQYVKRLVRQGRTEIMDRESPRFNPCARLHRTYKVYDMVVLFGDTSFKVEEWVKDLESVEPSELVRTHDILFLNFVPAA